MKLINPDLSEKRRQAGRHGGLAVLNKYGPEYFHHIGKLGGRPRCPTLADLQRQQSALRQEELEQRRNRLPGGNSLKGLLESLKLKIDTGELLCCGWEGGSPKGVNVC